MKYLVSLNSKTVCKFNYHIGTTYFTINYYSSNRRLSQYSIGICRYTHKMIPKFYPL